MSQSKKMSLVESITNIAVGFVINVLAQHFIFPHFGINLAYRDNINIAFLLTGVSLARSFTLRRIFNKVKE